MEQISRPPCRRGPGQPTARRSLRWALIGLAFYGLAGCPGFGDKTLSELAGIDDVPTWEGEIKALVAQRCGNCHQDPPRAGAPFPLVTFEEVVNRASRVRARAVTVREMPPGGGLSDGEAGLLGAWIEGGTPRGEIMQADAGEPDMGRPDMGEPDMEVDAQVNDAEPPPPPNWNDDVSPILANSCAFPGCHGGDMPTGGLNMETYAGFQAGGFSGPLGTDTGNAEDSLLIQRLRALNGLPLMPQGGPALDDALIETIEAWILAGTPEE